MRQEQPVGFCQCGCGRKTNLAKQTNNKLGITEGDPVRFILGHQRKGEYGEESVNWKGGRIKSDGYIQAYAPDHPRSHKKYILEHILVVEKILGKFLPLAAVVHHQNLQRGDNSPSNLVVCQDANYHKLIHIRTRAYRECGNASWRKCPYCKRYDSLLNLVRHSSSIYTHPQCKSEYDKKRKALKNEKAGEEYKGIVKFVLKKFTK